MNYDVIIVGACTAGTFFANQLAMRGLSVLVIDKDSEQDLCKRLDIIHFTRDSFEQFGVPESLPGDEEFVRHFNLCYSKSALNNHLKENKINVSVLHLPLFIKRLRNTAKQNGVEFLFEKKFVDLLRDDDGRISGVITEDGSKYTCRLVVDASGIPSVVRRVVRDKYVEDFAIGPRDKFYVLMKYVKLNDPNLTIEHSTSWQYYKGWIAPQHTPGGAIIGVGANLSFDYARKCMAKFESAIPLPDYTLQYEEMGSTPYTRPPFSFVGDGFLCIGDAAALTKPMNGEGIPMAWGHCMIAADVVAKALKEGYPTAEKLWDINVQYQRAEGAEYAGLRAMLVGAMKMTAKDNDYLFKESIVFKSDDYVAKSSEAARLVKGVFTGQFALKSFVNFVRAIGIGNKLTKHYKNFPTNIQDFDKWRTKALKLWKKAGSMADTVTDAD